jgi:hypothetical protein
MPISFTRATWTDYVGPPFMQASEANRLETAIDALINGTSRAVYRDGDTITGNLTVNGWIESDGGYRDAGGVTRISATGAGVFSQATISDVPDTRVMFATTAGRVTSDASFLYIVGTGRIQAGGRIGFSSTLNFRRAGDGAAVHFETGNTGTNAFIPDTTTTGNNPFLGTTNFRWQGIYGGLIDSSGSVNAATSLQTAGVTRISSTGAGTLASVTAADLTANLPVYADASKKLATESASAFRSRISAQAQDAKLDAISAGETAARVWAAKYNATVGGYSVSSIDGRLRFGNGVWLYLAAGSTTLLKSTNDGATWSTITPGATFFDLCWHSGASLWVAVGTNICYTSPDGTTWTARTIPAGSWRACASNGTTVIAGSVTCTVAYSTNATSWTSATTPSGVPAAGFYAACWSATIGKFLLIGSGNASTSTTGTGSWTAITNPSCTPYWCGDLDGRFVAVDLSTGPSYSTDGVTWSSPRRTPSAKSSFVGFASSGVVGFIGGATEETQAISTDGETWMPVDFGYTGSFNGVGYGNGWFLALDSLGFVYRSRG